MCGRVKQGSEVTPTAVSWLECRGTPSDVQPQAPPRQSQSCKAHAYTALTCRSLSAWRRHRCRTACSFAHHAAFVACATPERGASTTASRTTALADTTEASTGCVVPFSLPQSTPSACDGPCVSCDLQAFACVRRQPCSLPAAQHHATWRPECGTLAPVPPAPAAGRQTPSAACRPPGGL